MDNATRPVVVPLDPSPTPGIERVLLDFSGVLYDDSHWRRWLLGLVTRLGLHTHYTPFFRVWDCEFQRDVWCGRRDFWSALREFLLAAGLTKAQTEEIAAATRAKLREFDNHLLPFAGVRSSLQALASAGNRLSVVSRRPQSQREMQARLQRLGLGSLIGDVFATEDPKFVDNADLYFQALVAQESCNGQATAYVGRDRDDLAAARRAGMLTIAFNYDADAEAHLYIEQFDQLFGLVDRGGNHGLLAAG